MGWDVEDPAQVIVEYTTGNNKRADYALLTWDGKLALFIEVKKLDRPLADGLGQSISYCIEDGVQYFPVTDGERWDVYETHKPVPIAQKKVFDFNLHGRPSEFVLSALWLWCDFHATAAPATSPVPVEHVQPPPPPQPPPLPPPPMSDWKPFSGLQVKNFDPPPQATRFPDGTEVAIRKWVDLCIEVIRWLSAKGILTTERCPIQLTNQRYLIGVQPIHPTGKSFVNERKVGGLYVEVNYNAPNQLNNARFLVETLGQYPGQFSVRF